MTEEIAQARQLREQARKGGLRFDAYLPPDLAEWVLDLVDRGVVADLGEAVFVIFGEHRDLEPHADLREEALRRACRAASDDTRPGFPHEDVIANPNSQMCPRPSLCCRKAPEANVGIRASSPATPDGAD